MDPDKSSAWLRKLDAECPYQVVLPRRQLSDDSEIMDFLLPYVGKFDMSSKMIMRPLFAIALPTPSTPKFFDHGSRRKPNGSGWQGDSCSYRTEMSSDDTK